MIVNIDQHWGRAASSLGYAIMLAIAEYDNGDLSLGAFQATLRELAQPAGVRAD